MLLTASIVTYNTPLDELQFCIDALVRDGVEQIYIIDNSPTADLRSFCKTQVVGSLIEYIPRHDNPGYGAAHNMALRAAIEKGTRYHLVINSDVNFQADTLPQIISYMNLHPEVGQLQPRIISLDGNEQYSSRLLPSPLDLIGRRFLPTKLMQKRNRRYLLVDRPKDTPLNIPYHQGSFMFFRVSALKEIGLFDERFFMYPEDIDISRRMHEKYKTMYWPKVTVTHAHRASSYHSIKMLRIHVINMIRYFNKWGWFHDPIREQVNHQILREIGQS